MTHYSRHADVNATLDNFRDLTPLHRIDTVLTVEERHRDTSVRICHAGASLTLLTSSRAQLPHSFRRHTEPLQAWRMKRVVEFVDANLDQRITLPDMAAAARLTRMYFAAQFRAATGIRP